MKFLTLFLVCAGMTSLGCGSSNAPGMIDVDGVVTLDGAPIEEGKILFRQVDGDQRAFATDIVNGTYQLQSLQGNTRVEIRASRIIPGKFDMSNGTPEPMGEMYIPKRYNKDSDLTATINSDQDNQFNFELTSK
ncbi:hypothetical protein [Bremerella alba]|uniref:Carboxypeptidase regulatory-like domain-containing protein n=1 Tax=Bremerella alba TaxID=980252 RepID=A0A7V8V6M0_9BACT|nr:hypothetical protein [Bremerella alba]MBA2115831.1 hypothetical protein [Bremerella alba]